MSDDGMRVIHTLEDDFVLVLSRSGAMNLYSYLKSQFVHYDSPEMWSLMRRLGVHYERYRETDSTSGKGK